MTSEEEQPSVLFERVGDHVAVITLNRPDARNAINVKMAERIEAFQAQIERDPAIRVGIVAATGPAFCAGADLRDVAAGRGRELARPQTGFAGFVYASRSKPWIAAVQGPAHGGGTEIALACDLIIAGAAASFALPEVKRGLIAGAGGSFRLARALPRAVALEMIVTGDPISAARALALGLVNHVVDSDAVVAEAIALAQRIAANSPLSVRESLAVTRAAVDLLDAEMRTLQDRAIAVVLDSPDVIEGARAFVEKRSPEWRS